MSKGYKIAKNSENSPNLVTLASLKMEWVLCFGRKVNEHCFYKKGNYRQKFFDSVALFMFLSPLCFHT
jgi:hypothetical protein